MNILKDAPPVDRGFLTRFSKNFELEKAWAKVQAGHGTFRFFRLERTGPVLTVSVVESLEYLHCVTHLAEHLPAALRPALLSLGEPRPFAVDDKVGVLQHLHLDWLLAVTCVARKMVPETSAEALRSHVELTAPFDDARARFFRTVDASEERSTLRTFNQDSTLVDRLDKRGCRNLHRLPIECLSLAYACRIVRCLEVDRDVDTAKLYRFLKQLHEASLLISTAYPALLAQPVVLKLRKIRHTRKLGLTLAALQHILIDPRDTASLWHELGHWAHLVLLPELREVSACEQFAETFEASVRALARSHQALAA